MHVQLNKYSRRSKVRNTRIRPLTLLIAFIIIFSVLLAACQPAATEEPAEEFTGLDQ